MRLGQVWSKIWAWRQCKEVVGIQAKRLKWGMGCT